METRPWILCLAAGAASAGQLSLHENLDSFLAAAGLGVPRLEWPGLPVPARNTDVSVSRDHFFGITGDMPITRVRYTYGLEINDQCCEEIVYDSVRVVTTPVPEPTGAALMLAGGLGWLVRRRCHARA